jgi:hypothetical protein
VSTTHTTPRRAPYSADAIPTSIQECLTLRFSGGPRSGPPAATGSSAACQAPQTRRESSRAPSTRARNLLSELGRPRGDSRRGL